MKALMTQLKLPDLGMSDLIYLATSNKNLTIMEIQDF